MNNLSILLEKMTEFKEYSVRGFRHDFLDPFLVVFHGHLYVVFIVRFGGLRSAETQYHYALFSRDDDNAIGESSSLYAAIASKLPVLDSNSAINGVPDFAKKKYLRDKLSEIIGAALDCGELTPAIKNEYIEYLQDARTMKTDFFQGVYDFFSKNIVL